MTSADEVWFLCGSGGCDVRYEPAGFSAGVAAELKYLIVKSGKPLGSLDEAVDMIGKAERRWRAQFKKGERLAAEIDAYAEDIERRRAAMRVVT